MSVNDLSGLTMKEEDIVTLLVNLLDNAMEACEKLDTGRIIRLKMILEDGELTLSVKILCRDVKKKGKYLPHHKGGECRPRNRPAECK